MPELVTPQEPRDVDLEKIPYLFQGQSVEDAAAVKLVRETFGVYERGRQSHERRWAVAERLYHGVVEERKWEGTEVKRASLPVPIVYDQIESAFPIITKALFEYYPTFFEASPLPGTHPAEAARMKDVIAGFLETPYDETGLTAVPHMELAVRQALKYGDGVIELSWDAENKRPVVEFADLRDVYMDPTTPGPLVDLSPVVIHRKKMSVEQLARLRGTPGVNVPSDAVLNALAKMTFVSSGDISRQHQAAARGEMLSLTDLRTDPRHQLVEVLVYWTRDRLIWVAGRIWAVINRKNPFGFIPYCKAPFCIVDGRPYSMGVPDVLEGDQKYAQGIRNTRLDNLSLAMNPPRFRQQGTPGSPSKLAWRPGLIDEVSDVGQVTVAKVENYTGEAFQEEQLIHNQAAKRLGINEFVQSGLPTPSNANRSATGIMQQAAVPANRLSTAVKNFEDYMIVPMLYKIQKMVQLFAPEVVTVAGPGGQTVEAGRKDFFRRVRFKMEAASRMITKDRLAMFLGPVSQLLFNDVVMNQANIQGQTLDFREWERFFQDATGTARSYKFFRPMSPEEQQASQRPDPKTRAEMQQKMMDAQTRVQMGQLKAQTEMEKAKLKLAGDLGETGEKSAREIIKALVQERSGRRQAEEGSKSKNA